MTLGVPEKRHVFINLGFIFSPDNVEPKENSINLYIDIYINLYIYIYIYISIN